MTKVLAFLLGTMSFAAAAKAEIRSEKIQYKEGSQVLEGELFYNDEWKEPRAGVLIVHQWMGITDHEKNSAQKIVEKGYSAFVADIYGKDKRPQSMEEAGKLAGQFKGHIKQFRTREKLALEAFQKTKKVDPKRIVIAGYCFGGTGALEAARAGLPVVAAVSFHGGLATPEPEKTKDVKAKILVLHGAVDPHVPQKEVDEFFQEMNRAKADFQFIAYSGAVHAFTQKEAGNDPSKGAAYNESADRRSWEAFSDFLHEVLSNIPPSVK